MVPTGTAFSWTHVEDAARGHYLAMERGRSGESYIIAGPSHTVVEALAIAERITGVPVPRLKLAPGFVKALAAVMRQVERVVPVPANSSAEYLRVAAGVTYLGSAAKASRELGFTARSLEDGLRDTFARDLGRPLRG